MAEKGEWEKLDKQHKGLILILEAACSSDCDLFINAAKVERILKLLSSAIQHCVVRKDQIAPLINSFAKSIDAPTKA
jgi:hypothetical protein